MRKLIKFDSEIIKFALEMARKIIKFDKEKNPQGDENIKFSFEIIKFDF